jgi:hypothetical protein
MFLKLGSSDGYASKSQILQGTLVRSLSTVHEVVVSSVLKVVNRCLLEALLRFRCPNFKGADCRQAFLYIPLDYKYGRMPLFIRLMDQAGNSYIPNCT